MKKSFFSRGTSLVAAGAAVALMVGCSAGGGSSADSGSGDSAELETVTVAISSKIAYFVPYLMEEHWGEFEKQGIDLEVEIAPAQDALVLLATDKLDAMVTGPSANLLNAVSDGTNIRMVAPGGIEPEDSINGWYVSNLALDGEEFDPKMLEGKTIASSSGTAGPPLLTLSNKLAEADLTLDDVTIQSMKQTDAIIALENGAVFGATASQPNTSTIIEADSGQFFARSAPIDYPSVNLWFGPSILDDDPELGERFVTALHNTYVNHLQGDWLHDPENIDLISKVLETDVEILEDIPSTLYPEEFTFPENFVESYEEAFWQMPGVLTYDKAGSVAKEIIDTRYIDVVNK